MKRMTPHTSENGIALVITLWVIVVLSTVSLGYLRTVNLELKMTGFQRDVVIADSIARAGMQQALILLREDRLKDSGEEIQQSVFRFDDDDTFEYDGGNEAWAENPELLEDVLFYENADKQGFYFVEITDEASKFPLNNNKANLDMLAHLLELTGVDEDEARGLAGAIIDWRDPDTIPVDTGQQSYGQDGASETAFYNSGSGRRRETEVPDVIMKNGPIGSLDELLLIPGMTPEILYGTVDPEDAPSRGRFGRRRMRRGEYLGLMHYATIYSDLVNLNTVKQEVLESLLYGPLGEQAEEVASEWVDYRNGRDNQVYTDDDEVLKTVDNSDLDDVHYTEVEGMTDELVTQFGQGLFAINTRVFKVECLAEYEGIEKGYRAIIGRTFTPWDRLPVYGVDTVKIEDLEQVQLQVRVFEPIYQARQQIESMG